MEENAMLIVLTKPAKNNLPRKVYLVFGIKSTPSKIFRECICVFIFNGKSVKQDLLNILRLL